MSSRIAIRNAIITLLKTKLNGVQYTTNLYNNVSHINKPFQDMVDFPAVSVSPGPERREYQPSGVRWGYIPFYIRIFTKDEEDPQELLEKILIDIEQCLDDNDPLEYSISTVTVTTEIVGTETVTTETVNTVTHVVTDYSITGITTDEGLLLPYGVGEIVVLIRYQKT